MNLVQYTKYPVSGGGGGGGGGEEASWGSSGSDSDAVCDSGDSDSET